MDEEKKSEQSYAYTPGLKVKRLEIVEKERLLPVHGNVLVKKGDKVDYGKIVAEAFMTGDPMMIKVAMHLGVENQEIVDYMVKKVGDPVEANEPVAKYRGFFGLVKKDIPSPVKGVVETISTGSGQVIVRGDPIPVNVDAYIPGEVIEVKEGSGAVIRTKAAIIQGIFGVGGETHGFLKILVKSNDEVLTADKLSPDDKGRVVVGGSLVTLDALKKAVELGVSGVVAGGVGHVDLKDFMGRDLGVAITGQEKLGISLIITEGFGKMTMSNQTFNLLKDFDGKMAHINGTTQIRAGVMRPEIIIPHEQTFEKYKDKLTEGMVPGVPIRIIRKPYFGAIGKVHSLPVNLVMLESESLVRVLEAELDDGRIVMIPRANVEIIEE
jgi:hypothetical protein